MPPIHYGGIERIVDMLARGLVRRGARGARSSPIRTRQRPAVSIPWPGRDEPIPDRHGAQRRHARTSILAGRFDIVHSFSRVAYLAPLLPLPIPKLMTYQRDISRRSVLLGHTTVARVRCGFLRSAAR